MEDEKFYVVKIIDEYTIVINYGEKDGAFNDESIEVYVEGDVVKDPISGKTLDRLDLVKAKVIIETASINMSVCKSPSYTNSSLITEANELARSFTTKKRDKLKVSIKDISGGFPDASKSIMIGDYIRVAD